MNFHHSAFSNTTGASYMGFATSPSNLVKIGQIIKKWQQFFAKQYGSCRHLEFSSRCVFPHDRCVLHQIHYILTNLVEIGRIVMAWQQFSEIQDSGSRHLEFLSRCVFRHNRCILHRICYIITKFGESRSNSKEMATVFRNSRWRLPPS